MTKPPEFSSVQQFRASLGDVDLWKPLLDDVLRRHDLADSCDEPVPGFNPTNPTFICGDVVVKLFGYLPPAWLERHAAECEAHRLLAMDPQILAPELLGEGQVFNDAEAPWFYLITSRVDGVASWRVELSPEQRRSIAVQLGQQIKCVHALPTDRITTDADWPDVDIAAGNAQSSLPQHLVTQIDSYLTRVGPFDRVFLHGDVVAMHVYIDAAEITGIIDWGDAMVTDRHYEVVQMFRDTFNCDRQLLRVFLDASDWPSSREFPRQAMSLALYRQAIGIAQHGRMDVFEPIAEQFPLEDIATLDELAHELFDV